MQFEDYLAILYRDIETKFRAAIPTIPATVRFEFINNEHIEGIGLTIHQGKDPYQLWFCSPGDDEYNTYWEPMQPVPGAPLNEHGTLNIILDQATVEAARNLEF